MKKLYIFVLLILCFCTFFVHNAAILPDIMECRNIVTAREMVEENHWLVPTMNGELRLAKPPLPTWVAAMVETLAPDNLSAQRAMAGMAATMLVIFFFLFGRRLTGSDLFAWVSTLVLLTSYNIILMGRTASWDIYAHGFMLGAIWFMTKFLYDEGPHWGDALLAGLFMALSFMSKGPVSFYALLLPFLVSALIFRRPSIHRKGLPLAAMIACFLIVGGVWYVYICIFHADMAFQIWGHESTAWFNHNTRPWFYYWTFFLETGIWALVLLTSLAFPYWKRRFSAPRPYLFVLLWLALQVVFLSFFPEKKNRYLLPLLIPAAYCVGYLICYWHKLSESKTPDVAFRVNAIAISVVCSALPVLGYVFMYRTGILSLPSFILLTIVLIAILVWLWIATLHFHPLSLLCGVVAVFVMAELFVMPHIGSMVNNPDYTSISSTRENQLLKPLPFYYIKGDPLRIELVYDAHKKILPLNVSDTAALMKVLPCALITYDRVNEVLSPAILCKISALPVGRYDNNRRAPHSRFYKQDFICYVSILRKK